MTAGDASVGALGRRARTLAPYFPPSADLSAHRTGIEAHHGIYRVRKAMKGSVVRISPGVGMSESLDPRKYLNMRLRGFWGGNGQVAMDGSDVKRILTSHAAYLKEAFYVKELGIFGSFAKGKQKKSSDVDVLVVFDKGYKDFLIT